MQLHEFAKLVKQMRDAQTAYFKARNTVKLEAAFAAEKKVDAAIEEILNKDLFKPDGNDGKAA